jgi:methyl-accepting chemotaxis protein
MNRSVMGRRVMAMLLWSVVVIPASARAQSERGSEPLSAQDREVLGWANQLATEVSQTIEKWMAARSISEEKLFGRLYYPIARTDPPKYTTEYSDLADRDLPPLQEAVVKKSGAVVFAVVTDINGYLPTHNQRYSQPLTGNRAFDLVNNRTKRIFGDRTGIAAARNEAPYLLQRYKRDTGELMADLSVPVRIHGKHWGCVRIGYRQVERP